MNERHDQSEQDASAWLHWIEEATEREVHTHFSDDPATLEQVLACRSDRSVVANLRDPAPPAGLLESAIAEATAPMATVSPGAARRTRRRAQRWRDLPRQASMAAAVLIGIGVVWFAVTQLVDRINQVTVEDSSSPVAQNDVSSGEETQPTRPFYDLAAAVAQRQSPQTPVQPETPVVVTPVEAPFAVSLQAVDLATAEWTMCAVSQSLASDATVVRNLSTSEVEHLYGQALATWRHRHDQASPWVASDRSVGPTPLAPTPRRGLDHGEEMAPPPVMPSGVLAGDQEVAPSFQEQLRTSARGAPVTVVLRARDLPAMLAGLSIFDRSVTLVMLSDSGEPPHTLPLVSIKEAMSTLDHAVEADALVHLPVIFR